MIGQRIKQARLAAGFSLDGCVKRLSTVGMSITKPALSQYENGKRTPRASVLKILGSILSVPASYFLEADQEFSIVWYSYRAKVRLGKRNREEIQAYATHQAEKFAHIFDMFPDTCCPNCPDREKILAIEDADAVAARIRAQWKLGRGALESVVQCLESKGIMIIPYNRLATTHFDGLSALVNHKYPLIIANNDVAPDRLRFDLSHELGHVLMDTSALGEEKKQEAAAHRFASSFIVPPEVLKAELGSHRTHLMLSELLVLKQKYGMSVGALLFAARVHGIIGERIYTMLQKQLSARGWRRQEPAVFQGNEQPARVRQLVTRAIAEGLLSLSTACALFPDLQEQLQSEFGDMTRGSSLRRRPTAERARALEAAAAKAAAEYENDPGIIAGDGGEYHEYR